MLNGSIFENNTNYLLLIYLVIITKSIYLYIWHNSFIYLVTKYFLSTCLVPGTVKGSRHSEMDKMPSGIQIPAVDIAI